MNNLKVFRRIAGLTQKQLEEISGISQGEISKIENNYKKPKIGYKRKFSKIFGISEQELFPK